MFSKNNKIGSTLFILGIIFSSVNGFTLDNAWLDMIGLSIAMTGIFFSKKSIIESNGDYGLYLYYTLLAIFVVLVFLLWFM